MTFRYFDSQLLQLFLFDIMLSLEFVCFITLVCQFLHKFRILCSKLLQFFFIGLAFHNKIRQQQRYRDIFFYIEIMPKMISGMFQSFFQCIKIFKNRPSLAFNGTLDRRPVDKNSAVKTLGNSIMTKIF